MMKQSNDKMINHEAGRPRPSPVVKKRSNLEVLSLVVILIDALLIVALVYIISAGRRPAKMVQPPPYLLATLDTPELTVVPTESYASSVSTDQPPAIVTATDASYDPTSTPITPTPASTRIPYSEGPITYGVSHKGRNLIAYRLGTGSSARAIIGGIHGGYEWNTVDLVSQTLTYFQQNPGQVPTGVTLYVIPCANPDGYAKGFDLSGRTNANDVDLNRNWEYHWQITATHGTRPVYAGESAFSEPETASLRDFILEREIELVIFYHSAMGKIFSGAERTNCRTYELAEMMEEATGYLHDPAGIPGQITTGDAIDWLSARGIAGIEVELTNHQDIEWDRNLGGILAFLNWTIPTAEPPVPPVPAEGQGGFIIHTVQLGETLSAIAAYYGVSEEEIIYLNNIVDRNMIGEGQKLRIPNRGPRR